MSAPGKSGSKYLHTDQERDNNSHDDFWGVNVVEIVGENAAGTALVRQKAQLVPGADYDYIDVQQTDTDTETFVYKLGGSGGATVRTVVVNYTNAMKNDIDNVSWS